MKILYIWYADLIGLLVKFKADVRELCPMNYRIRMDKRSLKGKIEIVHFLTSYKHQYELDVLFVDDFLNEDRTWAVDWENLDTVQKAINDALEFRTIGSEYHIVITKNRELVK